MSSRAEYDTILPNRDGWVTCPICNKNKWLHKIEPDENCERLYLYCRQCKRKIPVRIREGQCFTKSQSLRRA